jgi:hypothetical protein
MRLVLPVLCLSLVCCAPFEEDGGGCVVDVDCSADKVCERLPDEDQGGLLRSTCVAASGRRSWVPVDGRDASMAEDAGHVADQVDAAGSDAGASDGSSEDASTSEEGGPSECSDQCSGAHAKMACVGGACAVGECDDLWGDCNGDPSDGCETDLTEQGNCGECGHSCQLTPVLYGCRDTGMCCNVFLGCE